MQFTRPTIGTKLVRIVLSAVLACSVAGMAGCRDSAARTQKIVGDPGMYEVDNTLPPYAKPSDVGQQSTATEVVDEDEYSNDYDYDIPDYANNVNWNGVTAQQVTGDSPYDGEASSGVGDDTDDAKAGASTAQANGGAGGAPGSSLAATGTGAPEGTQNPDDPDNPEQPEQPEQPDDPENPEKPENPETPQNPDSPIGGEKEPAPEWDRNESPKTEVPESRGGIAAFGPLAAVVQSLGGPGALRATNAAWLSDAKSRGAFPGELEGVTGVASWSPTSLSDDAVSAVVASGADTLLVSRYCGGLPNSAQAQYLAKNGVNVVSMPTYGTEDTQDSDIQTAVLMVGTMLRANFEGAYDRYKAWKSQHDGALSDCRRVNGGYTTAAMENEQNSNYLALGLAPFESQAYSSSQLGYMLNARDLSSNRLWYMAAYAYDTSKRLPLGYLNRRQDSYHAVTTYYLQHAGWANAIGSVEGIDPTNPVTGQATRSVARSAVDTSRNQWSSVVMTYAGEASFPGAFCYDETVARGLQQTYRLGVAASALGQTSTAGLRNRYNLYVVPSGVSGNWFDASFETFLLAPYAMRLWTNSVDADSYMQAFYQTFYRCNFNNGALSNYGTVLRSNG